ncbi:MAG TPA: TorF family putative porin [Novosphingobium sp.]
MIDWKKASLAGAAALAALTGLTGQAHAEDGPVKFSGGVTLLTDYRLRGASLSDTNPVIQGVVQAEVPINETISLYGGIWASSLDKDAGAGAMETDFYGGVMAKFDDVTVKARYLRLVFHDANNIDFDQFEVGVSAPVGPIGLGVGAIHDEYNGGGHSTYVYTNASYAIPDTGIGLSALVGYEDGTNWNNKINWSLGATYTTGPVTFGATYIDTNKFSPASADQGFNNRAGGTVVFSVGGKF